MDHIVISIISLITASLLVLSNSSQLIAEPLTDIDTTNNTQGDVPINKSQLVTVNITAFVNQTSNELLGFRPIDPTFCDTHPDSPICKPKIEPPFDNQCFRRPNLCDPCMDPTAICPPPKLRD